MSETTWKFGSATLTKTELDYWQGELNLSRAFRKKNFYDDESNSGRAMDCYKYYKGDQEILNVGLETPIVDNQVSSIVTQFIAAIMHQNPDIIIKEKRKPEIPYQKEIAHSVFSYFQNELKMDWHNHQALVDSYITGLGVKVNGYSTETASEEYKETVKEKVKRRKGLGRGKGTKMVEEEVEKELIKRREWITKEFPTNVRHSPFLTLVDPRSKCSMPYDGKWIAHEYELPYQEVKNNPKFDNTEDLKPTGAVGVNKDRVQWDDLNKSMCHIYQIQISRKDGLYILTMAKNYDKPLRYVKYPFIVEGFLTTFLTLNDAIDEFYPPIDVERIIPLQDEVNYIQSRILEGIYKFLPKVGINMDHVKDEQEMLNAIEKGDIGTIIKFQGQNLQPNAAAQVLQFDLDLRNKVSVLQALKQEIRIVSGITEAELTGQTNADTATEASIGQRGSFSRINKSREKVRRFLKEDMRKFKQICMQACNWKLITRITGIREQDPLTGQMVTEKWLELNSVKDALVGEYDIDIDIISGQQPNPELKRRQILESANFLFAPNVEQKLATQGMKIDYVKAAKEFLRTMDQFRGAADLIVAMSQEESKQFMTQQMMQSKAGQQMMAQAPQGAQTPEAARGEAQSMGEMIAANQGAL